MTRDTAEPLTTRRRRLLRRLHAATEISMVVLALVWLWLFVVELVRGLTAVEARLVLVIWVVFVLEFLLRFGFARHRVRFIRRNFLILLALLLPALRVLRFARLLHVTRAVSSTRALRALSLGSRLFSALQKAQGPRPQPEMNIGIMLAVAGREDAEHLREFATCLASDIKGELETATGLPWHFHDTPANRLSSDTPRRPSDFLDEGTLRMAEGPFDMLLVVTDVALGSRHRNLHAGLVSPTCRLAVMSTRQLLVGSRSRSTRKLEEPVVRWNAAALALHLFGHALGLRHVRHDGAIMCPWHFDPDRTSVPAFSKASRLYLHANAPRYPEREMKGGNPFETLIFHLIMAARHPAKVIHPLLHNRAPLLPLSLPGLATAAVAPGLLLVFTAEIWDVALNMADPTAWLFSFLSVLLASVYLTRVQNLFLPRREKKVLTEHLAVANVAIFLSILVACLGLLLMVASLMLVIAIWIFPPDLMHTWSTLDTGPVDWLDKLRLGLFIGGIGVATGALAGGLESRSLIQNLALFRDCE